MSDTITIETVPLEPTQDLPASPDTNSPDTALREPESPYHATVELVEAIRAGSEEAWPQLIGMYRGMIVGTAYRQGVPHHKVDDVVQNTFLTLFRYIYVLEQPDRLAGWLQTVTVRETQRIATKITPLMTEEDAAQIDNNDMYFEPTPSHEAEVVERLLEEARKEYIRQVIPRLPKRQAALLQLFIDNPTLDYRGLAELFGTHIGGIGPTRGRLLASLLALIEEDERTDLFD